MISKIFTQMIGNYFLQTLRLIIDGNWGLDFTEEG